MVTFTGWEDFVYIDPIKSSVLVGKLHCHVSSETLKLMLLIYEVHSLKLTTQTPEKMGDYFLSFRGQKAYSNFQGCFS